MFQASWPKPVELAEVRSSLETARVPTNSLAAAIYAGTAAAGPAARDDTC